MCCLVIGCILVIYSSPLLKDTLFIYIFYHMVGMSTNDEVFLS